MGIHIHSKALKGINPTTMGEVHRKYVTKLLEPWKGEICFYKKVELIPFRALRFVMLVRWASPIVYKYRTFSAI